VLEDHYVKSSAGMPITVPLLRPFTLSLLILLLNACGGGSGGDSSSADSASQDAGNAMSAALRATLDLAAKRVTLQWYDSFATATRYQIEQQSASGAWVAVEAVWAPHGQTPQNLMKWTGSINEATTLRVEAVLQDRTVPLAVYAQPQSTSLTIAPPAQIPSIMFDQPEPLQTSVNVSIANDESFLNSNDKGSPLVTYVIDDDTSTFLTSYRAPGFPYPVGLSTYTTGTHHLAALMEHSNGAMTWVISRNVQIHSSNAAISLEAVPNLGVLDFYAVATSDSGIVSVVLNADSPSGPTDTLIAPNACVPQPCGAGQPFNAYRFSFDTKMYVSGYHIATVEATDNAGTTAGGFASFTLPAPPTVTLDSPVDGAVVAGTLHLAGTFASGTPGALELMVTLSGVPIYDTTVANTGAPVPYSVDVSLAGVSPGSHTVGVYSRVGNSVYTSVASAIIQVTP
jgi:hypothetical protein